MIFHGAAAGGMARGTRPVATQILEYSCDTWTRQCRFPSRVGWSGLRCCSGASVCPVLCAIFTKSAEPQADSTRSRMYRGRTNSPQETFSPVRYTRLNRRNEERMISGLDNIDAWWFQTRRPARPVGPWVRRQTAMAGVLATLDRLESQGQNGPLDEQASDASHSRSISSPPFRCTLCRRQFRPSQDGTHLLPA